MGKLMIYDSIASYLKITPLASLHSLFPHPNLHTVAKMARASNLAFTCAVSSKFYQRMYNVHQIWRNIDR